MDNLKTEPEEGRRTSTTNYLEPTAPPPGSREYMDRAPPPAYEEKENHYQVPIPSPRAVHSMEMKPPPQLPESQPPETEDDQDEMNRLIKNSLKGFNSNKWMHIKLTETKGWCGFRRIKKFVVKGQGGIKVATVKTDPTSCDCCVHLLFCGCLKKPKTFKVRDNVGNEVFHFKKVTNCCRIKPTMVVTTADGREIGKIVKNCGIRPSLTTYDYNGDEKFTLRGPWSAALFACGKMIFYASAKNENGETNIGKIQKLTSSTSVRFQTEEKGDRVTKLLLLASAFMVDLLYYKQTRNDKPVPNE